MRLLICCWLLSAIILKNYYCGELFGLMTINDNYQRVETIGEFIQAVKSGKINILGVEGIDYYIDQVKVIFVFKNFVTCILTFFFN